MHKSCHRNRRLSSLGRTRGGLNEDVSCPKCQYNLRGLTVPRCPECGFEFAWADLPKWRQEDVERREKRYARTVFVSLAIVFVGFLLLCSSEAPELAALSIPIAAIAMAFAVSAAQACIEVFFAWPIMATRVTGRRFRAWWEGVLIGYGLSAATMFVSGHGLSLLEYRGFRLLPPSLWFLLAITTAEACLAQWWVVRRRSRQWNDPIPPRRLFLACVVAKFVVAIPWAFCPFSIVRV
jgi:hypothetical protein